MSCPFSNILGEPGKGVHSIRIFNIAVVDVLLTVLLAWGIHYWTKFDFWIILLITFLSGIIIHRLFCVKTTLDKLIFGN
jgi:fatty acid desaturase